ncbi:MAG: hypothetical protein M3Q24_01715 [bacterium]|nr:hypothetical protein [bacterium]
MNYFFQKINISFARFSIFLVYFWFGILKVLGLSPASAMVLELLNKTLPFVPPNQFLIFFGLFEVLIGLLFLIPKFSKIAITLLFLHLGTTVMPLFVMPEFTWSGFLVPTLEGQYIIKNILIIALAFVIGANLRKSN